VAPADQGRIATSTRVDRGDDRDCSPQANTDPIVSSGEISGDRGAHRLDQMFRGTVEGSVEGTELEPGRHHVVDATRTTQVHVARARHEFDGSPISVGEDWSRKAGLPRGQGVVAVDALIMPAAS
jgi:hypothetical protein